MGTRKTSADPEQTKSVKTYCMARVFRGLLDLLSDHNASLLHAMVTHIRGFDNSDMEDDDQAFSEVMGFWRTLLELIVRTYVQLCINFGILMVASLVILTWPVRFMIDVFGGSWFGRNRYYYPPEHIQPTLDPIPPVNDNHPDSGEVVRRVVYEEAKIPKVAK